jgi:hypothetical protein
VSEEIRITPVTTPGLSSGQEAGEPSLRILFRQLAEESGTLVRQEVALAKTEMTDNFRSFARGAVLIGVGVGLLTVGLLVLVAFAVIGLGALLGGEYWLSTLLVGGTLAFVGGITFLLGKRGFAGDSLKPAVTSQTLRENRDWAAAELRRLNDDVSV